MTPTDFKQKAKVSESRMGEQDLGADETRLFAGWLNVLNRTRIPYMVGGAFALHAYTSIWRFTKDLDVFLKPGDLRTVLDAMQAAGYETEVRDVHWLAKVHERPYLLDLIFSVSNNLITVADDWMDMSRPAEIAGVRTRILGPEDLIASKMYVARSDRFDGADIVHVILATRGKLDWCRLRAHMKDDLQLLYWYLVLFDFVYPGHRDYLPTELMAECVEAMRTRWLNPPPPGAFKGMRLDPLRFAVDVEDWNYFRDPAMPPAVDQNGDAT